MFLNGGSIKTHRHLTVLYVSTFFLRFAFASLLLLLAWYVPSEGAYSGLLGVAIIAVPYPFAEMVTANMFGMVSDRVGRKRIIVFGTSLAAATVALYSLSNNVWYLAVLHGIHGVGAAATVAPAVAMIADHAHPEDRGRQMGLYDYSTFSGYILGPVFASFIHHYIGMALSFFVVSGLLFFSALILHIFVVEDSRRVEASPERERKYLDFGRLKDVFKIREIGYFFPIWLIISTLLGLAITYVPRILKEGGMEDIHIGLLFGAAGMVLGLLQPLWGKLSDRIGRLPVMYYGVISIFGVVLVLLLFQDRVAAMDPLILGLIAVFGIGIGAFIPAALALMADASPEESYGATMGLYSFALGFGSFIAEISGLLLILIAGRQNAPLYLLYLSTALISLALLLILRFVLMERLQVDKKLSSLIRGP